MGLRKISAMGGFMVILSMPNAAYAQAWIGQVVGNMIAQEAAARQEYECMTGTAMPNDEVAEASVPAEALMRRYWDAAASGQPVNLGDYFHANPKAEWKYGAHRVSVGKPNVATDPFANATAQLAGQPIALRSGDGSSAYIQWEARNQTNALIGTYHGRLVRQGGVWKLSTLELFGPKDYVEPLVQYCHKLNDVLPYRVKDVASSLARAEKNLAKRKVQVAKAEAAQAKAKGEKQAAAEDAVNKAREKLAVAESEAATWVKKDAALKAEMAADDIRRAAKRAELGDSQ